MSWRRVGKSFQALSAHTLLLCFTVLLVLKLDHVVDYSWWIVFFPLWLFHVVVARGRFSLPAPSVPHDRNWAPCHAVVAIPLLIAFELLLCIHLESIYVIHSAAVNLKIVFLPLLAFELIILIDNFRMCKALLPGDDESMNDEAIWETLPHFWVAISMVFFVAATVFTLLKLCGMNVAEMKSAIETLFYYLDQKKKRETLVRYSNYLLFCRYNTFCGYPPEIVKKMPKKDLAEEVWRLQAALGEQAEITKLSQQEYERLQNEKVLCRVCFEGEISTVLLPCRHRVLCSTCCEKCKRCPICRVFIEERLPVYDV
uniref:RING-type domain-containing protein n=1 Tax=Nicotiana tabacum TaxID=4097 RepID=A0A1S3X4K7_TOBAC|nr:PREDICTED: uncharacterized protein LOC107761150 [Nicotiana tabacum]